MIARTYRLRAAALCTLLAASLLPGLLHARSAAAAAPSMRPDMPAEIVTWRLVILPREEYVSLVEEWRAYARAHPQSAVAHVQLSRAMRYAGAGTPEEREALIAKALELDENCPEALEAMASTHLTMQGDLGEARRLALRAVAAAPEWPDPRFTLASIAMVQGETEVLRAQLQALLERGGIATPVLDFGYNLLVSAAPGGIVFTNGDNDTYPPLALQLARGIRPDVRVVNLSLLNLEEYATNVWKSGPRGPLPFTAADIARDLQAWEQAGKAKGRTPAQVHLEDLVDRIAAGTWKEPVYLACTVSPNLLACCEGRLEIEGMLWRVTAQMQKQPEGEKYMPVDASKTLRLFREDFRLDSATDLGYAWGPASSAGKLMINYPATLQQAAQARAKAGDLEDVRYAMTTAIEILRFHGQLEMAAAAEKYWKEVDPQAK